MQQVIILCIGYSMISYIMAYNPHITLECGCLGPSYHELVEIKIFSVMREKDNRVVILDFRRANFKLFKELFSRVPWKSFEGLGVHEFWLVFKSHLLEAEEQAIPLCYRARKRGRRPAWPNRELFMELKRKKNAWSLRARSAFEGRVQTCASYMQGEDAKG